MTEVDKIKKAIMVDPENTVFTDKGWLPIFSAPETARILIVGQAPGARTQETGLSFMDPSGDNLRSWLGVDKETFYHSGLFAILPMDFYFPGKGPSGDLPPRKNFAKKWHPLLIKQMPQIELTLLIGAYAQQAYLEKSYARVTENVRQFESYGPVYFPLVHPSPRNNIWQVKNPWFQEEVLPQLQTRVKEILAPSS